MTQNGKGHDPRPFSVSQETYKNNYERTFGKKEEPKRELPEEIQEKIDGVMEKMETLHKEILNHEGE